MYNSNDENLIKLKKKIRENPQSFIFILGSGMSVPAGLPSWEGLLLALTNFYENYCRNDEDSQKNVEILKSTKDYWNAFAHLKRLLPELEYEKCIMEQLSDKGRTIPKAYELIWQLDINGVITFNIDKLILNAFSKVRQSFIDFATGKEKVKYSHFLSGEEKFVFFRMVIFQIPLHGYLRKRKRKKYMRIVVLRQ